YESRVPSHCCDCDISRSAHRPGSLESARNLDMDVLHRNRRKIARLRMAAQVDQMQQRAVSLSHQAHLHQSMRVGAQLTMWLQLVHQVPEHTRVCRQTV